MEATAELIAVIVAVTDGEPRVLTIEDGEALPSGPFELSTARCRRACAPGSSSRPIIRWDMSSSSTHLPIGTGRGPAQRMISISYLGLTREARVGGWSGRELAELVSLLPVGGSAGRHARDGRRLSAFGCMRGPMRADAPTRRERQRRVAITFGAAWNEELILQRYELLWEAGLVPESPRRTSRRGRGR